MNASTHPAGTVIIVGASRGLGLGLVKEYLTRGWAVHATYRNKRGHDALAALAGAHPGRLTLTRLDITSEADDAALLTSLAGTEVDLLFINAGISGNPALPFEEAGRAEFLHVMETNTFAPMRLAAALKPVVKPRGTIAVMSSNMGSISGNQGGEWEIYRASKAALGQLMKSFAHRHPGDGYTYLLVSPGWVRTDMGGSSAPLDVETSAAGMADAMARLAGAPGIHFIDYQGRTVAW
jgi:NAD(P)-dependent dehydrogenase (short-subunit alcohol dehydrogenase family)